jgi:predicted double-glycine peptidase
MNPWVESCGVLLLAAGGMLLGAWFSRLPGPWWLLGYLLPLTVVASFALAIRMPAIAFTTPICWLIMGRTKFAVSGFVAAMMLTTLLLKLPKRCDRAAVMALMACVVCLISVWPFLAPAFNHKYLASLTTRIGNDGVCLQNTDYTCGPASAVTALRKLGFPADEGEIAILAYTSSTIGTPPDILADALQKRYGNTGLICDYRAFKNLAELKNAGLTLAVIKYNLLVDHYVTVLEVTDKAITIGDPLNGLTKLSPGDFNAVWRFEGVVLRRK